MWFMAGSRLVEVKCPSTLRDDAGSRFSYQTTVEGRVKAQVSPRQVMPRTWDVAASVVTPPDQAVLDELASGGWGDSLRFVPAEAPNVNVLTPAESMFDPSARRGVLWGGPVDLGADGVSAQSLVADGAAIKLAGPPDTLVIPGQPVTGSAWVRGVDGYVMVQFLDRDGQLLYGARVSSEPAGSNTQFRRVAASTVVPDDAVVARLTARDMLAVTRPAVTWTDSVMPFGHGRSAHQVTIDTIQHNLLHTYGARTFADVSYTVQEVG